MKLTLFLVHPLTLTYETNIYYSRSFDKVFHKSKWIELIHKWICLVSYANLATPTSINKPFSSPSSRCGTSTMTLICLSSMIKKKYLV